jgi:hypothetical protein
MFFKYTTGHRSILTVHLSQYLQSYPDRKEVDCQGYRNYCCNYTRGQ